SALGRPGLWLPRSPVVSRPACTPSAPPGSGEVLRSRIGSSLRLLALVVFLPRPLALQTGALRHAGVALAPRPARVTVPVVDVRVMGVRVGERSVRVAVAVRLVGVDLGRMLVLVMLVVDVPVLVGDRL